MGKRLFVSLLILLTLTTQAFAEQPSQNEQLNNAKTDIESLYQQWRRELPQSLITYSEFKRFLDVRRSMFWDKSGTIPSCNLTLAFSGLKSGAVIKEVLPAISPSLAQFTVVLDGLDYTEPQKQEKFIFKMDQVGHITNTPQQ